MGNIYELIADPKYSLKIFAKARGKNRARKAVNDVYKKIYNGGYDVWDSKIVFLKISTGSEEITVDEISAINDSILNSMRTGLNVHMEIDEKNLDDEIELQLIFSKLNIDTDKLDFKLLFNSLAPKVESLPIYFLEDEYDPEEMSAMISCLSDLYKEIGGDALRIKGFSKVQLEKYFEPSI